MMCWIVCCWSGARLGNANETRGTTIGNLSSPPPASSPLTSSIASGHSHSTGAFGVSPFARMGSVGNQQSVGSSIYDFAVGGGGTNMSPSSQGNTSIVASMMEVQRLRDEVTLHKATMANYEEKLSQAMNVSAANFNFT